MQDVIVFLIVAVAACYVIYKYVRSAKSGKCSGGCGCDCEKDGPGHCCETEKK